MEISLNLGLVSFFSGLIAGVYGAAVGGGALLTVPALLFVGLNPIQAVATSKLGSLGTSSAGLLAFGRSKRIDWKLAWMLSILLSGGSALGALLLLSLPMQVVKHSIAIIILSVLCVILIFPTAGIHPKQFSKNSLRYRIGILLALLLGVLTGFYQGGSGTLLAYIMILFFGQTFLESAGTRKLPFLISNIIVVIILIPSKTIHLPAGVLLGLGTFIGGYLGSLLAIKKGNRWTRNLFLTVVAISGLRMIFW